MLITYDIKITVKLLHVLAKPVLIIRHEPTVDDIHKLNLK